MFHSVASRSGLFYSVTLRKPLDCGCIGEENLVGIRLSILFVWGCSIEEVCIFSKDIPCAFQCVQECTAIMPLGVL